MTHNTFNASNCAKDVHRVYLIVGRNTGSEKRKHFPNHLRRQNVFSVQVVLICLEYLNKHHDHHKTGVKHKQNFDTPRGNMWWTDTLRVISSSSILVASVAD